MRIEREYSINSQKLAVTLLKNSWRFTFSITYMRKDDTYAVDMSNISWTLSSMAPTEPDEAFARAVIHEYLYKTDCYGNRRIDYLIREQTLPEQLIVPRPPKEVAGYTFSPPTRKANSKGWRWMQRIA